MILCIRIRRAGIGIGIYIYVDQWNTKYVMDCFTVIVPMQFNEGRGLI